MLVNLLDELIHCVPSKHTGSDLEAFCFVMASYSHHTQPESGGTIYARSDFLRLIWFRFSKGVLDHTVQNWPRSGLNGLVRFWPNASGPEASVQESLGLVSGRIVLRMQPACYQFPTFRLGLHSSTDGPDHTVQNQAGFNLVLADCLMFWPTTEMVWSGCKPVCKNHPARFWPMLPSWSGLDVPFLKGPACLLG